MSFFEKLTLQGIRCFGPDEGDKGTIRFGLPLTLILGNNGCGKTTIIESLNYACCGKMPPGCSGQGNSNFVHDPTLTCRPEVKGKVQLTLKDVRGNSLQVTRIAQVAFSQRNNMKKLTFKSIDQSISRLDEDGRWVSISGRCADADMEMCIALGVSKAILSNVLLCHQEDSNWPLDEDSKVKVKFDEIFGSDKYNKCLDQIRVSQKALTNDESNLKVELRNLETYKNDASAMRARLEGAQQRYDKYKSEVDEFEFRLEPIQSRLKELAIKEDEIVSLRNALGGYQAKLEAIRSTMEDLKSSIKVEFSGTKQELQETIENFASELRERESSLESLEYKLQDVEVKLRKNEDLLSTEQCRLGQFNSELDANKKRIANRNQAMVGLSEQLEVSTSQTQLTQADEIQRVLFELENAVLNKETEVTVLKEKHTEAVTALQKETSVYRENRAKINSSIGAKKEQLQLTKTELQKVKESIREADQSAELLTQLQAKLELVKKELDGLSTNDDTDSMKSEIQSAKDEINRLEDTLTKLEKEVGDLQMLSQIQVEFNLQKNSKDAKDAEIKRLKSKNETVLKEILEVSELPEQGLKFKLDLKMEQLAETVRNKTEQLRKIDREISNKEAENKHMAQKLNEAKKQLEADDFAVKQACNGQDYEVYTAELSSRLEELHKEKGMLSASEHFYSRYLQKLKGQKPCCPLCNRGFTAEKEVNNLVSDLTSKVREAPSQLRQNNEELTQVQDEYKKLLELKSKHEKVGALRSMEIPALEKTLERSNSELKRLKSSQGELQEELEAPQLAEGMARSIQNDISILDQNIVDSSRLAKELEKIEEKLKRHGSSSSRTLQDALDEQKKTRNQLQLCRKNAESLEAKLRKVEMRKMKLQEDKLAIEVQQFKVSGNSQRRAQLSEKKDELEAAESAIHVDLQKMDQDLTSATRQIESSERKVKALQASNASEMEELNRKVRDVCKRFEEIKQLNSAIVDYELSGSQKKLEICKQTIKKLYSTKDELNLEMKTIGGRCENIKTDLASQRDRERDLNDNMKLKTKTEEKREIVKKVDELNAKIGNMNSTSLLEEKSRLKQQEAKLYFSKKEAEGSLVELKKNIDSIQHDLEKPHLKYAEKNYGDTFVHLNVIIHAKKNLDNYYAALDWALMSYHQKKIKHINTVINELWRRVYSGNDIDAIHIRAETEPGSSASKRRAFKYRVTQTKCGSEIEMRNRCSAGQKVLASLIIRIALAETFSAHCGVLALDEPTTNLDQENIVNLSQVLLRLVRLQHNKKNFQLMVITHDQEFLKELTKVEFIDHYFKLERNQEGKSKVVKVNIC
ncbi:DNA repair protein RAD50 [Nesidiocoris tenuis]|uniref:DNA repair protein RAD50 n=1 Tax=Nesidiocoris tenuis TaxID=355587 RepID=A0ABN7AEX6_9HEMI|nr:DNA repair protein RAD50 [Nesidiocoris tenuis]